MAVLVEGRHVEGELMLIHCHGGVSAMLVWFYVRRMESGGNWQLKRTSDLTPLELTGFWDASQTSKNTSDRRMCEK